MSSSTTFWGEGVSFTAISFVLFIATVPEEVVNPTGNAMFLLNVAEKGLCVTSHSFIWVLIAQNLFSVNAVPLDVVYPGIFKT